MDGCTAAQVVRVIGAFVLPSPLAPGVSIESRLADSPAAWELALAIVSPDAASGGAPPEAQFFCANLLLSKVRAEWLHLPPPAQAHLSAALWSPLQSDVGTPIVRGRLCLALAAAAALAGPDAAQRLLERASSLAAQGSPALATSLLQALADETEPLDGSRRKPLLLALRSHLPSALHLLEQILAAAGPGPSEGARRAIGATQAWVELGGSDLDCSPAGCAALTLGTLAVTRPALFARCLHAVEGGTGDEGGECGGDASGELATDAADLLSSLLASNATPVDAGAESAAVGAVGAAVAATGGRHAADSGWADRCGGAVARLGAAIAERRPEWASSPAGESLAHAMLALAACPHGPTAESALDYFLGLASVPTAARHPPLVAPLYSSLLGVLLRRAAHGSPPAPAGSDEASAHAVYREQHAGDAMDACLSVLRGDGLHQVGAALAGATAWQTAETPLWALRHAAPTLKPKLEGRAGAGAAGGEAAVGVDLMDGLMRRIAAEAAGGTPGLLTSHPLVIESVSRLVGAYASWLAKPAESPRAAFVLPYLLRALAVGGARAHAAVAFRALCARCAAALSTPSSVQQLLAAASAALQPSRDGDDDGGLESRTAVMEGLARLVARLPRGCGAPGAALQLTAHAASRLGDLTAMPADRGPPGAAAIAGELSLLSSALRFLDCDVAGTDPGVEGHPAVVVLESAWPALSSLVTPQPHWSLLLEGPGVASALGDVLSRAVLSAKAASAGLLPHVVPVITSLGAVPNAPHCLAAALDALSTVVEVLGAVQASSLASPLESLCASALGQPGAEVADPAGVAVRSALDCGRRCLVFAPVLALMSAAGAAPTAGGLLGSLLRGCIAALRRRERDPVASALAFLAALCAKWGGGAGAGLWGPAAAPLAPAAEAVVAAHGPLIMTSLMVAACDACPAHLLRQLGGAVVALLEACPAAGPHWLAATLGGDAAAVASEADRRLFGSLLLAPGGGGLSRPRREALVADFGALCRREATSDVLLAYQL